MRARDCASPRPSWTLLTSRRRRTYVPADAAHAKAPESPRSRRREGGEIMSVLALLQVAAIGIMPQMAATARHASAVLEFPQQGLDDSASYQGYRTRFYRDSKGNALQIYVDARSGRVVNLWADAF